MNLSCENLHFSYQEHPVLEGVSFDVPAGIFCALLGRNGSGKTTLLRCLNGLLHPEQGSIRIGDLDITTASQQEIAKEISMVPQEHTETFPFSVLDMVVMGRTPHLGMFESPSSTDYQLARSVLKSLDGSDLSQRNFNRISGGERQIALLARAMVQSSATMLLDEPTNHLDFNNQFKLLHKARGLCRKNGSRVIASMHDPNLAYLFADQVIMIKDGKVVAQGPPEQAMTEKNVEELYGAQTCFFPLPTGQGVFIPASACPEDAR